MKKLLAMTAVALLMSTTAFAGSETKNLKLNTDVLASCQVSLDHDININYSPDSMSSVVTPINIICTEGNLQKLNF